MLDSSVVLIWIWFGLYKINDYNISQLIYYTMQKYIFKFTVNYQ